MLMPTHLRLFSTPPLHFHKTEKNPCVLYLLFGVTTITGGLPGKGGRLPVGSGGTPPLGGLIQIADIVNTTARKRNFKCRFMSVMFWFCFHLQS
jgi:hypothetical protein